MKPFTLKIAGMESVRLDPHVRSIMESLLMELEVAGEYVLNMAQYIEGIKMPNLGIKFRRYDNDSVSILVRAKGQNHIYAAHLVPPRDKITASDFCKTFMELCGGKFYEYGKKSAQMRAHHKLERKKARQLLAATPKITPQYPASEPAFSEDDALLGLYAVAEIALEHEKGMIPRKGIASAIACKFNKDHVGADYGKLVEMLRNRNWIMWNSDETHYVLTELGTSTLSPESKTSEVRNDATVSALEFVKRLHEQAKKFTKARTAESEISPRILEFLKVEEELKASIKSLESKLEQVQKTRCNLEEDLKQYARILSDPVYIEAFQALEYASQVAA